MTDIIKEIVIPEKWAEKFDTTVDDCSRALAVGEDTIMGSVTVMNGIRTLKKFFKIPDVKELVEMSKDNHAGFLTDKKNYSYDQLIDALLPCILEGYRPHGNEINIISGKGMPVKAGKFRRIISLTEGFKENIGTVKIKDGFAFVKCRAKWMTDGKEQSIGHEEGDEVHIKLKYGNQYDSLDKARGLAQSKLYTQVLTRILGRFIADEPESIDITDAVNTESENAGNLKPAEKPDKKPAESQADIDEMFDIANMPPAEPEKAEINPVFVELESIAKDEKYREAMRKLTENMDLPMSLGNEIKVLKDENSDESIRTARGYVDLITSEYNSESAENETQEVAQLKKMRDSFPKIIARLVNDKTLKAGQIDDAIKSGDTAAIFRITSLINNNL